MRYVVYNDKYCGEYAAKMNSRERIRKALLKQKIDRIPVVNIFNISYLDRVLNLHGDVIGSYLKDPLGTEFYSMKVFPYESVYIGLIQVFHNSAEECYLDVQLAVSRDGIKFERVGDRSDPDTGGGGGGGGPSAIRRARRPGWRSLLRRRAGVRRGAGGGHRQPRHRGQLRSR